MRSKGAPKSLGRFLTKDNMYDWSVYRSPTVLACRCVSRHERNQEEGPVTSPTNTTDYRRCLAS